MACSLNLAQERLPVRVSGNKNGNRVDQARQRAVHLVERVIDGFDCVFNAHGKSHIECGPGTGGRARGLLVRSPLGNLRQNYASTFFAVYPAQLPRADRRPYYYRVMETNGSNSPLILTSSGSRISVRTSGTGAAQVFVVGGFGGASIGSGHVAATLAATNTPAVLMDIAGSGQSRHPGDLTVSVLVQDVEDVFRQCLDRKVLWVGTSLGAWLMMIVHQRHPEWFSGMCAVAPAFDWHTQYLLPALDRGELQLRDGIIVDGDNAIAPQSLLDSMADWRILDKPLALEAPLHILFGGRDKMIGAAALQQFLRGTSGKRCTAEYFADLDHAVAKLQSFTVRERFQHWLSQQLSALAG